MKKIICLIMIFCALTACTLNESKEQVILDDSRATDVGISAVVRANNQFAFELFSTLESDENIFISPYSISSALAMTYEGARGNTAEEMKNVFHFPMELKENSAAIYNEFNSVQEEYTLTTANALWVSPYYSFLPEYLSAVKTYYGGNAQSVDFDNPQQASEIINAWVEEQTNNKIKDLLSPSQLDSSIKLVLTNAIYFKGQWKNAFEEDATEQKEFKTALGERVSVPMMYKNGNFNYAETEEVQLLEIPYEGDALSMVIILPKENGNSAIINAETINEYLMLLNSEEVNVYLPRFTFKTKYDLNNNLIALGMPTAFTDSADFSGMTSANDLYIDFVVHQAFIDVNEEGTEAAAATAVGIETTSVGPSENVYTFNADHPFIFIIKDNGTGMILFMGKVNNPLG